MEGEEYAYAIERAWSAADGAYFTICRCDTWEKAAEVIRILLSVKDYSVEHYRISLERVLK